MPDDTDTSPRILSMVSATTAHTHEHTHNQEDSVQKLLGARPPSTSFFPFCLSSMRPGGVGSKNGFRA